MGMRLGVWMDADDNCYWSSCLNYCVIKVTVMSMLLDV
jgi:hypothetical protein